MIQKEPFIYFSLGGAPDWPPCDYVSGMGDNGENDFLPESLNSVNAFVLSNG